MMTLGEKISSLRKAKGMTQEYLAEKCSVSAQAVSKWENNLTAPDISLLPKLSELFGVSVDELLGIRRAEVVAVDRETVDLSKMLLKVRIIEEGGDKLNFNLPLSVAEGLIKGGKLSINGEKGEKLGALVGGIDFSRILSMVKEGAIGKLAEIEDGDGDRIEIWIE